MRTILLAVQSVDGFITRHDLPGSGFASVADQMHLSATLNSCDCAIMGAQTYRVSRDSVRSIPAGKRLHVILTRSPEAFSNDSLPGTLEFTAMTATEIAQSLQKRGFKQCALLGGGQINALFLEAGLVDELWLTLEPRLFGRGVPVITGKSDQHLRLISTTSLSSDTLLLKYAPSRRQI